MKRKLEQTSDGVEQIALAVLGFLVDDDERLVRFVQASGLTPDTLRHSSSDPGFLAAVLDHVMGDEETLLDCARALEMKPETIARAWRQTQPQDFDHTT